MKGFKSTGNGPKYGSFTFSSKAGFGPSSGSVKSVSGYTRRAPKRVMKKAIGGLATGEAPNTPGGPADFAKGGMAKRVTGAQITPREKAALSKKVLGAASTPAEVRAFNRTPKIGK